MTDILGLSGPSPDRPPRPSPRHRVLDHPGTARLTTAIVALLAVLTPGFPGLAEAEGQQDPGERRDLLESRDRLSLLQEERQHLQHELERLEDRVADVEAEVSNLERQLSASRSSLAEIRVQADDVQGEVEGVEERLDRTREDLDGHRQALRQRMREAYKRGPLHTVEVLLGADSFADLLNRYRYLQLMARYDQNLVELVGSAAEDLETRSRELRSRLDDLTELQEAQRQEVAELEALVAERSQALEEYRERREETEQALEGAGSQAGFEQLDQLVSDLDEARRHGPHDGVPVTEPPGSPTLSTAHRGRLPWPVTGEPANVAPDADGTTGMAIQAPFGEPVRAVRTGTVVLAGPLEGFDSIVILSHGEGYYTLYLNLHETGVVQGRTAEEGQVLGTVGGQDSELGPHLEFHLRVPSGEDGPEPADPGSWLQPGSSGAGGRP